MKLIVFFINIFSKKNFLFKINIKKAWNNEGMIALMQHFVIFADSKGMIIYIYVMYMHAIYIFFK